MCGIVGFYAFNDALPISKTILAEMRDTMFTRGPDDAGLYMSQENGNTIGLAHRRLSIIDLSIRGHQPMEADDGSCLIVFNGEIFNFEELRTVLKKTGRYCFRSSSDTEVLLYSIKEWGIEGCLSRIRGMYSFGFFNREDWSLTLVRDPLGVKPLYYIQTSWGISFASEIKALLKIPGFTREINLEALAHYLTFANSPAPQTMFRGVKKLEAGCYLHIDQKGKCTQKRYWDSSFFKPIEVMNELECVQDIRKLFRQAVSRRMVSDVPFGVFLSGGVDSSVVAALLYKAIGDQLIPILVDIGLLRMNEAQEVREAFEEAFDEIDSSKDYSEETSTRLAVMKPESSILVIS